MDFGNTIHNLLMDFGNAIHNLRAGNKVARSGWNGKGMWLIYIPPGKITIAPSDQSFDSCGYIALKNAQDEVIPWNASQADMLAEDWSVVK